VAVAIASQDSGPTAAAPDPETLTSVDRALALLDAFGAEGAPVGVTELARRAGLAKSTAHRLLSVLERRGLVTRQGVEYSLGLRLFELGSRVPVGTNGQLMDVAMPYLEELCALTRQTVHLAVLDDADTVYLAKLHGRSALPSPSRVGARLPAHCTGLGKAMLAFSPGAVVSRIVRHGLEPHTRHTIADPRVFAQHLDRIRHRGISFDQEETRLGLGCVAAPVLDSGDRALAAISVAGPVHLVAHHTSAVRRTADSIRTELGAMALPPLAH
jgi:DNA-binding IclR family transcriptional regulator